jgi:hypothetical protein
VGASYFICEHFLLLKKKRASTSLSSFILNFFSRSFLFKSKKVFAEHTTTAAGLETINSSADLHKKKPMSKRKGTKFFEDNVPVIVMKKQSRLYDLRIAIDSYVRQFDYYIERTLENQGNPYPNPNPYLPLIPNPIPNPQRICVSTYVWTSYRTSRSLRSGAGGYFWFF